jgi:hypothetical protein
VLVSSSPRRNSPVPAGLSARSLRVLTSLDPTRARAGPDVEFATVIDLDAPHSGQTTSSAARYGYKLAASPGASCGRSPGCGSCGCRHPLAGLSGLSGLRPAGPASCLAGLQPRRAVRAAGPDRAVRSGQGLDSADVSGSCAALDVERVRLRVPLFGRSSGRAACCGNRHPRSRVRQQASTLHCLSIHNQCTWCGGGVQVQRALDGRFPAIFQFPGDF